MKLTLGIRYSYDNKYGTESIRLTCFTVPACVGGATPERLGNFSPLIDLTQVPTVVDSGVPGPLPKGVTGLTTYNTKYAGLATRGYNASWEDAQRHRRPRVDAGQRQPLLLQVRARL